MTNSLKDSLSFPWQSKTLILAILCCHGITNSAYTNGFEEKDYAPSIGADHKFSGAGTVISIITSNDSSSISAIATQGGYVIHIIAQGADYGDNELETKYSNVKAVSTGPNGHGMGYNMTCTATWEL